MVAPESNLPPEAQPFGRYVLGAAEAALSEVQRVEANLGNTAGALSANVTNLSEALRNLVSGSYTKTEIDAFNAAFSVSLAGKADLSHTHDASAIVSGTIVRDVDTTGYVAGNDVYARSLATNITAARVSLWGRTGDGYIATATSSERNKGNIVTADIDPEAVLSIEPVYFNWKSDLAERQRRAALDAEDPEYDPDLHIHTEVGFIAERMHEAGLWEFVVYRRNPDDSLVLDDDGEPIPDAIHYVNWGIALQAVARKQAQQIIALEARLTALENRVE